MCLQVREVPNIFATTTTCNVKRFFYCHEHKNARARTHTQTRACTHTSSTQSTCGAEHKSSTVLYRMIGSTHILLVSPISKNYWWDFDLASLNTTEVS